MMIARGFLLLISGFGLMAGAKLALEHIQHGEICPVIGPIPACIIVFLGYLAVFIAGVFIVKAWSPRVFYIGWTPIFLLALIGVSLEIVKGQTCPPGPIGIPQCFFSLAMAGACWDLFRRAA